MIYKQNDKFGNPTEYPIASNYIQDPVYAVHRRYNTWKYITDPQDSSKYLLTTDARSICGISYVRRMGQSTHIVPLYMQQPYQNIAKWDFISRDSSSASADSTPSVTTTVYNDQWSNAIISMLDSAYGGHTELSACEGSDSSYNYKSISFELNATFDNEGRAKAFLSFLSNPSLRTEMVGLNRKYNGTTFEVALNGKVVGFFDCIYTGLQSRTVRVCFVSNFISVLDLKYWSKTTINSLSFNRVNVTYVKPTLGLSDDYAYTYTYDISQNRWISSEAVNLDLFSSVAFDDLRDTISVNSNLIYSVSMLQAMSKLAWLNNWVIDISGVEEFDIDQEFEVSNEGMGYTEVLASGTHFRGVTNIAGLQFHAYMETLDATNTAVDNPPVMPLPVICYIAELTLENLKINIAANTLGTDEHEYNENDLWGRIDLLPVQHPTDSKGLSIINCEISKFVIRSYNCPLKIINSRIYYERTDTFNNKGSTDSENFKTYEYKSKYHSNARVAVPSINSGFIWSDTYIHNSYLKLSMIIKILATKYAGQAAYDYDPPLWDGISFEMCHSNLTISDEFDENVSITYPIYMNQNVRPYLADITGCYITCIDGKTSISSVSDIVATSTSNVSGTTIKIDNCTYNNVLAANNLYYYKN